MFRRESAFFPGLGRNSRAWSQRVILRQRCSPSEPVASCQKNGPQDTNVQGNNQVTIAAALAAVRARAMRIGTRGEPAA
jgi:hypothetical protein